MRTANENMTFSVLAGAVEDALQDYRDTEQTVKDAESQLRQAKVALSNARTWLDKARDEFFAAHPELQPVQRPVITNNFTGDADSALHGGFRPVEVDDPDEIPDFREAGS